MRTTRILATAGLLVAQLAAPVEASAAEYSAPVVGLASAYAVNSQTTGWADISFLTCDVGAESLQTGDVAYARCALEFDLGSIPLPAGAVIVDATLNVYTPVNNTCAGNACDMTISGYAGNAASELADFTGGSMLGSQPMGLGSAASYSVTEFVKSIKAGPTYPVAGFLLARDPSNPANDRLTVGHPASAHPPTLIITYGLPVQVATAVVGAGTVTGEASPISCPPTCAGGYVPGSIVKLTASPGNGYAFSQWVGSPCAGQGSACTFTMPDTAVSVTAVFLTSDSPSPTPKATGGTPAASAAATATTPGESVAPTTEITAAPASPAPTIVGLDSDSTGSEDESGLGGLVGILVVVAVILVVAGGIGYAVYRLAAARTSGP